MSSSSERFVVVCGPGGVGKTSTAAALAVSHARDGRRVLVVTVDPARRLAQALGVRESGNEIVDASSVLPEDAHGALWATMLDTKAGWDELVRRLAPDSGVAERIIANELYHNITARFVNSHDYIAMERLYQLSTDDRFDLVVVDTPPSRNALSLLDAPRRMREFFGSRLLKWLTVPYRSRLVSLASRPFFAIADRVLGARFLSDIVDFFTLMRTMEAGFIQRAREVEGLLASDQTSFVVVGSGEEVPAQEVLYLLEELDRRALRVGMVVLNRVLPTEFARPIDKSTIHEVAATFDTEGHGFERALSELISQSRAMVERQTDIASRFATGRYDLVEIPLVSATSDMSVILEMSAACRPQ